MFKENELNLEQLRLNSLEKTREFYLECLSPLVSDRDFQHAISEIDKFIANQGIELHHKLNEYIIEIHPKSWLMPYSRNIYLENREPVSITSNYFMQLDAYNKNIDYLNFVARLVLSIQDLYLDLSNDKLPLMKNKDSVLCKQQYYGFMRGSRNIGLNQDEFKIYEDFKQVNSILIFYQNNVFLLKLFNEDKSRISSDEIYANLKDIYEYTTSYQKLPLTLLAYNNYDDSYHFIDKNSDLKNTIEKINHALCGISLIDDHSNNINTIDKISASDFNMWPLKSWNLSIYQDLVVTFNNEHTYLDGLTSFHLASYLFSLIDKHDEDFSKVNIKTTYQSLNIDLDQSYLKKIKDYFLKKVNGLDSKRFEYDLNKSSKLKEYGINLDSVFQIGYLYANYYTFKSLKTIHESVSVAHYYDGRTASMKSISYEGIDFIRALKTSNDSEILMDLLKKASDKHLYRIKYAKEFIDIIRHYAGLNLMSEQSLSIYNDNAYQKYISQEISTSTLGKSELLNTFIYAPVVDDGLGIGYLINNNKYICDITYYKMNEEQITKFYNYLVEYYNKIDNLLSII